VSAAVLFLAATLILQLAQNPEPVPRQVNRLCGRLDYANRIKVGDNAYTYSNRNVLKAVDLELYRANGDRPCCADLERVAVATSDKKGRFAFRRAAAGPYWVKGEWNSKQFKLPIVFKPENDSATQCSEQGILLDDGGKAEWWLGVSVDSNAQTH
jgi:hypothetical protein